MKKILTAITVAVFIIYPSICFASYVIHLKDGREFVTDRYWEEGEQIKFKRYGGVIGIQKDLVKGIEEIEDLPDEKKAAKPKTLAAKVEDIEKSEVPEKTERVETGTQGISEGADQAKGTEQIKGQEKQQEISEEEKKKADQEKAAKMEAFLEEDIRIRNEMEMAVLAYKAAKTRKNKTEKDKYWNKLISLQKQLSDLEQKVKATNGGRLPDWWHDGTQQP